jgi:hypothetical protein
MKKTRHCPHCQKDTEQEVVCKLTVQDNEFYSWFCHSCARLTPQKNGGQWISKAMLKENGVDLGAIRDYDFILELRKKQLDLPL